MSMTFTGTDEQLSNALNHMAEKRPITKAEKAIVAEAAQYIKDTSAALLAAEELADAVDEWGAKGRTEATAAALNTALGNYRAATEAAA